jgi:hypothetical protein
VVTSKLAHERSFCLQVVARLLQTSVKVREDRRRGFGQYLSSLTDFDAFEGPNSFEPGAPPILKDVVWPARVRKGSCSSTALQLDYIVLCWVLQWSSAFLDSQMDAIPHDGCNCVASAHLLASRLTAIVSVISSFQIPPCLNVTSRPSSPISAYSSPSGRLNFFIR